MTQILGTNYMDALKKWVDEDAIPTWLGGKSQGTLLDDVGPWNDTERMAALGLDLEALRTGQSPAAAQAQPATSFGQASSFVRAAPAAAAAADGVAAAAGQERVVPAGLQPTTSAYYSPQGSMIRWGLQPATQSARCCQRPSDPARHPSLVLVLMSGFLLTAAFRAGGARAARRRATARRPPWRPPRTAWRRS